MARFALAAFLCGACEAAVFPAAFEGTWSPVNHTTVHAILGPVPVPTVTMTKDESNGDYWLSVIPGQVFRVVDDFMQYCFVRIATSPFAVDTVEDNLIRFCFAGPNMRMNTHKMLANGSYATGCDAAQIVMELKSNGFMEFTFYMSPPVKHAWAIYERTGDPPPVSAYIKSNLGGRCDPLHPGPPTADLLGASMCPALNHRKQQQKLAVEAAAVEQEGLACRQYDAGSWLLDDNFTEFVDVRLQYEVPGNYCWPCNVSYSLSAAIAEDEYIAVGFKGLSYRAYGAHPTVPRPNYFGMGIDEVDANRTTGAIVLGYAGSAGSCVREMRSENYVGAPTDVRGNPNLFDESVERVNGRTIIRFTIEQHIGRNETEVHAVFNANEWAMRTMWAIGGLDGTDCEAEVQFHRARGLSPLSWFGQNPACTADPIEFAGRKGSVEISI